jgi:hypothetical protein
MSDVELAAQVAPAVSRLGGGFMISRYAKALAEENGFTNPWASYFAGRCGVLGDVDPGVVAASVFFYNPDTVHDAVEQRRAAGLDPAVGAEGYRQACFAWGRARLDGFSDAGRLADLLEPLVDTADATAAPIFAGWRALARPEAGDDLARVALAAHLLREHRMAMHVVAVRALQMHPRDAILAGEGGEGNAAFFFWPPPYPDVTDLADARAAVEDLTTTLAAPTFAPVPEATRPELVALLEEASAHSAQRR